MLLRGLELEWVSDLKYLGIMFKTGSCLKVDASYIKRKFYTSCNAILNHCKSADDIIKLAMVKTYCLPYYLHTAYSALDLSRRCVQDLAVCWNDCFRRIFRYNRYESVKDVQYFCNELPLELLYDLLGWKFLRYVSHVPVALRTLFNFQRHVLREMSKQCGHAVSVYGMKQLVF